MPTHTHTHTYTRDTYTYTHTCTAPTRQCRHLHIQPHTRTHAHTHAHTRTHTHARTHAHTHTHRTHLLPHGHHVLVAQLQLHILWRGVGSSREEISNVRVTFDPARVRNRIRDFYTRVFDFLTTQPPNISVWIFGQEFDFFQITAVSKNQSQWKWHL